jgi:hypothetical protein
MISHHLTGSDIASYARDEGINLIQYPSVYTFRNSIIDRGIKTIRDLVGENQVLFFKPEEVIEALEKYNNSPHKAFDYEYTPKIAQQYPELEECYIRDNLIELEKIKTFFL